MTASLAADETGGPSSTLRAVARVFAVLFYLAQFLAAWYLTRLFFPASGSKLASFLKFSGILVGALICSVCGAVACEAFGYALFLRVVRRHM